MQGREVRGRCGRTEGLRQQVQFHRVSFGILLARSEIKGAGPKFKNPVAADLARRRFLSDGLMLLAVDIKSASFAAYMTLCSTTISALSSGRLLPKRRR